MSNAQILDSLNMDKNSFVSNLFSNYKSLEGHDDDVNKYYSRYYKHYKKSIIDMSTAELPTTRVK